MISKAKRTIQSILKQFNYEINRIQEQQWQYHLDAWFDQQKLVGTDSPVILDVGANIGQSVRNYLNIFNSPIVKCFEPFPTAYNTLCNLTNELNNVEVFPTAISDVHGKSEFYINEFAPTNSLLPFSEKSKNFVLDKYANNLDKILIETVTLDQFAREEKLNHVDILKIDVQGSELKVLKGAQELLSAQTINLVYSEVLFVELYESQCFFGDLQAYLQSLDYTLYGLYNFAYGSTRENSGVLTWADAIFISTNFSEMIKERDPYWGILS